MRKVIHRLISKNRKVYHLTHRILEYQYGHERSRTEQKSVDKDGNPIPWFTYPAIEFLKQFNYTEKQIFEFGCGHSTLYWMRNNGLVFGVEDNKEWYLEMLNKGLSESQILLKEESDYVNSIDLFDTIFDIIVVDGKQRAACIVKAIERVSKSGLIILDNADRHPQECKLLRDNGFIEIDFHGLGPINNYAWTTSIFFKEWSFKPKLNQPVVPIGGGY